MLFSGVLGVLDVSRYASMLFKLHQYTRIFEKTKDSNQILQMSKVLFCLEQFYASRQNAFIQAIVHSLFK